MKNTKRLFEIFNYELVRYRMSIMLERVATYLQSLNSRTVSTWSSLGVAFNTLPGKQLRLGILHSDTGLFDVGQLTSPEAFYSMKERAEIHTDALIKEAISENRNRKMVDIFDDLSDNLCQVADLAEFIRVAHPRSAFTRAAEDVCLQVSSIVEKLNTHKPLYFSLKHVVTHGDKFELSPVDKHVAKLFLFDFEQSGIHLEESQRKEVVILNESILNLGQYFVAGSAKQRSIPKDTIPQHLHHDFSISGDEVIVNGLYAESPEEFSRETAYKVYLLPDKHQEYILDTLLSTRHKLATICGFSTYAHRAVKGCTAETPEFVKQFLDRLNIGLQPQARLDYEAMLSRKKRESPGAKQVYPWDVGYFTKLLRNDAFDSKTQEQLTEYLCLGACMEGLNNLTKSLYGIRLECQTMTSKEVWAQDVYKLAVIHETEGLLGYIYCDLYQRTNKPYQDSHFTIRGGRELEDGTYQNPIVVIMLNLPVPRWSSPCLLTPCQLDNLVHEMGHALHSMLARTRHQHVTGTRCATDFAEVPSILMEYFVNDPRVLKTFTKHYRTGQTMPDSLIKSLCASKGVLNAYETQTQLLYSVLDQKLHGEHPLNASTTSIFHDLQREYSIMPPVENTAWQLRFSHLVGYGAKYYSYLLSRSIASCIWHKYFIHDPFSREMGEKYRRECLSYGGSVPPRQLLTDFLNQEASPDIMAEALLVDIEKSQKTIVQNL